MLQLIVLSNKRRMTRQADKQPKEADNIQYRINN
jgi:hypothetical protein